MACVVAGKCTGYMYKPHGVPIMFMYIIALKQCCPGIAGLSGPTMIYMYVLPLKQVVYNVFVSLPSVYHVSDGCN